MLFVRICGPSSFGANESPVISTRIPDASGGAGAWHAAPAA